jgi:hypothetical protein
MELLGWCSIESKTFELAVEGKSIGVLVHERCRGYV